VSPVLPSLLLFARAPSAGRAKTRLAPALGEEGAARLYHAFLEDAARTFGSSMAWSPVLRADPDPTSPELVALFSRRWRVMSQGRGTLGARLAAAFCEEFRRGVPSAVAIGSDHPALSRRRVEVAFERLASGRQAVLVPAEDGGYCAIGLRSDAPVGEVFRDIPWSGPDVLETTVGRLSGAGLRFELLPGAYDVDRPADLDRLRADLASRDPSEADFPSATAAALAFMEARGAR